MIGSFPLRYFCYFGYLLLLSACAAPLPEGQRQSFVSSKEIQVVSLTREGLAYAKRGRMLDAELKLRQALYLAPDSIALKLNLAVVLDKQGGFEEAKALYLDLLEAKPESVQYRMGLAHLYFSQNDFSAAEKIYQDVYATGVERNDNSIIADAARSMAAMHFLVGAEEDAFCWSEIAFRASSGGEQLLRHARLLLGIGATSQSLELIEPLLRVDTANPRAIVMAAQGYYDRHDNGEVRRVLERLRYRQNLEPEVEFQKELLALLVEEKQAEKQEESKEEDEDQEDKAAVLDNDPLSGEIAIYWPLKMLNGIEKLVEDRSLEQEQNSNGSLFWN